MMTFLDSAIDWSNKNPGPLRVLIFLVTIILGWVSGIFAAMRRRPKFKITTIQGPTLCCTYPIDKKHGDYDIYLTSIVLYLKIANIGSSSSSIENISVGFHWHLKPFSFLWIKNTLGWFWIEESTLALEDFQIPIGENIKFYPFLIQHSVISGLKSDTYLEIGRSINGVVYFEQEGWGGCFPSVNKKGTVRIKVQILDTFGRKHYAKFSIPSVSLEEARKYNPSFGKTLAEMRGEPLQFDVLAQQDN